MRIFRKVWRESTKGGVFIAKVAFSARVLRPAQPHYG
jgi:hypothetical protein